jgi:hypothetical protein
MKFRPFRRFVIDDYPTSQSWFRDFLDALNPLIDTLNPMLQNGLDTTYNLTGERQVISLQHGVPVTVKLNSLKSQPVFVRCGYASGYVASAAVTAYNGDGSVTILPYFAGTPPASSVSVTVFFEP